MMKCPFCAEEIQPEAIKCRWCGESITIESKKGFPHFYTRSSRYGLSLENIVEDYRNYLELDQFDNTTINGALAISEDTVEKSRQRQDMFKVADAIDNRIAELDEDSSEAIALGLAIGMWVAVSHFAGPNSEPRPHWGLTEVQISKEKFIRLKSDTLKLDEEHRSNFDSDLDSIIRELNSAEARLS